MRRAAPVRIGGNRAFYSPALDFIQMPADEAFLITKAMMVVPGHCLAQASREFLQLYPAARILVADQTNFVKDKRQRFLARAATAQWDCIIITHSAFKFIPVPAEFERRLIADQIQSYSDLLERIDGADSLSRKRIERMCSRKPA